MSAVWVSAVVLCLLLAVLDRAGSRGTDWHDPRERDAYERARDVQRAAATCGWYEHIPIGRHRR